MTTVNSPPIVLHLFKKQNRFFYFQTNKITNQSGGDASIEDVNPMSTSIKIEQTLLDGQGRNAEYEKSKLGLNLSEAQFIKKEQNLLYL